MAGVSISSGSTTGRSSRRKTGFVEAATAQLRQLRWELAAAAAAGAICWLLLVLRQPTDSDDARATKTNTKIQKYTKRLEIQTQNQSQYGAVAQPTYFDGERRRKEAGYPDSRTRLWWPEMNLERILNCSNYPSLSLVAIYSSYNLRFLNLSPLQAPLVLKSIS